MKSTKSSLLISLLILLATSIIHCKDDAPTPTSTPTPTRCKVKCPSDKPWVSKVNPNAAECFKTKSECESYGGWDCQQCN